MVHDVVYTHMSIQIASAASDTFEPVVYVQLLNEVEVWITHQLQSNMIKPIVCAD